jgi:hypothetical protein
MDGVSTEVLPEPLPDFGTAGGFTFPDVPVGRDGPD